MKPGLTLYFSWIISSVEVRVKYFVPEILSPLPCTTSSLSKAVARSWSSPCESCVYERRNHISAYVGTTNGLKWCARAGLDLAKIGMTMGGQTNLEISRLCPHLLSVEANDSCLGHFPRADEVGVDICWKLL